MDSDISPNMRLDELARELEKLIGQRATVIVVSMLTRSNMAAIADTSALASRIAALESLVNVGGVRQ